MSVELLQMGKWQSQTNDVKNLRKHIHDDFHQVIFPQNSYGKLILDDAFYPFKAEHLYFTSPGVNHSCGNTKQTQYTIIFFKILSPYLAEKIDALPCGIAPRDLISCKQMLSQAAYEFSSETEYGILRANAYFELFLSAALEGSAFSSVPSETSEHALSSMSNNIERAASYIHNNFSSEISIDDLAAIAGFEQRQFFRAFRDKFGTSPNKYINELRISKAKTLLANTNMTIAETAEHCGFNTEHYFSRVFKTHEGLTPNEYRKKTSAEIGQIIF
ncbi:MAG: helix-turn-helix domain-containing protein [Oscillospiraceae bacterium]|nr:helix-turn-helix domain-containing protein [Oscillospiraceae bacterium]